MSSWPLPFLLDELWLKSHRMVVQSLEERGLWMETEDFRDMALQQKRIGESLVQQLLPKALGIDYKLLNSESFFGGRHVRLQRKLPFSLAFGHELGQGFQYLINSITSAAPLVSHTTALFNLGISLFDLYLDQGDNGQSTAIAHIINRETLCRLAEASGRIAFRKQCRKIHEEEKRVLAKIIHAFYLGLYASTPAQHRSPKFSKLHTLLAKAYQAEMNSQIHGNGSRIDLKTVAQSKSILPFMIIAEIALAFASPRPSPGTSRSIQHFSTQLGTVFWLLDDLSDLVGDFQSGQLNSFFLNGKKTSLQLNDKLLNRLLLEQYLDRQVTMLCQELTRVIEFIYTTGDDPARNFNLRQALLFYVRDWMN